MELELGCHCKDIERFGCLGSISAMRQSSLVLPSLYDDFGGWLIFIYFSLARAVLGLGLGWYVLSTGSWFCAPHSL